MNGITSQKPQTFHSSLAEPRYCSEVVTVICRFVPLLHGTVTWLETAAESFRSVLQYRSQIFRILHRPCSSNFPAECIIARIIITAFGFGGGVGEGRCVLA
jgi:hypothetical protein